MTRKTISVGASFVMACVLVAGAALLLPVLARSSNCGGNSAGLSACRSVVLAFRTVALARDDKPFAVAELSEAERENFRSPTGMSSLPGARLLVSQDPVRIAQSPPKKIIAVCDSAYDNVPQRRFWKAPMSHAVAYSDGSVGLISVGEFQRLDFSRFVEVANISRSVSNKPMQQTPR